MTYTINIRNNTSMYSTDELLNLANAGLLYCDDYCLTEFVDRIIERDESSYEVDIDDQIAEAKADARSELIDEIKGYLENL